MIKEITIYEVNDVRFDKLNDAAKYEVLCDEIERIMSRLKPRTKEIEDGLGYGKQNINVLKSCINDYCVVCAKLFPLYKEMFIEVANEDRHISHMGRIIYDSLYKVLKDAYFRFECIDRETGYEFQQPYYANHINEAFEYIKKAQEYYKEHGTL